MEKIFNVNIVKPDGVVYQGKVTSLIIPGQAGFLGILANHAPFLASTVPGKASIKEASGEWKKIILEKKGFLEVLRNKVTLILN
jgi:F-type H+-transporting ATPase subunit epsilon